MSYGFYCWRQSTYRLDSPFFSRLLTLDVLRPIAFLRPGVRAIQMLTRYFCTIQSSFSFLKIVVIDDWGWLMVRIRDFLWLGFVLRD